MQAQLTRTVTFCAAHHLPMVGPEHKCHRVHGHNYRVTLGVEGPICHEMGWVDDSSVLDDFLQGIRKMVDHQNLNELKLPFCSNPTAENLLLWVHGKASTEFGPYFSFVELQETERGTFRMESK